MYCAYLIAITIGAVLTGIYNRAMGIVIKYLPQRHRGSRFQCFLSFFRPPLQGEGGGELRLPLLVEGRLFRRTLG